MASTFPTAAELEELAVQAATGSVLDFESMTGFSGIELNADLTGYNIYWTDGVPEAAQQIIGEHRASGVIVDVQRGTYPLARMIVEAQEAVFLSDPTTKNEWQFGASPAPDGSGLVLSTSANSDLQDISVAEVNRLLDTDVPVSDIQVGGYSPEAGTSYLDERYNQPGGVSGGAAINAVNKGRCTTAVKVRDTRYDRQAMLTAAHCAAPGDFMLNNGEFKGTVDRTNSKRDIAIFSGNPDGYKANILLGSHLSAFTRPQGPMMAAVIGVEGVMSGSTSGTLDGVKIVAVNEFVDTTLGPRGPMTLTRRFREGGAAANGDSGGPFVRYETSRAGVIRARPIGLVSFGYGGARPPGDCRGAASNPESNLRCYNRVAMADIVRSSVAMDYKVSIAN